jgi:hypothetical protein
MSKRRMADVPDNIGPVVFGVGWVMIRCPRQYDDLMRRAGPPGIRACGNGA